MTNNPYLPNKPGGHQDPLETTPPTFRFSWLVLFTATLVSLVTATGVAAAERYFELWTYTSRGELARSVADWPPPNGGVLNNSDVLRWTIASTVIITLPYLLLTLLIFVSSFLWLSRSKPKADD